MVRNSRLTIDGVLAALKEGGFNDKIVLDGVLGTEGDNGLDAFLATKAGENEAGANRVIRTLRSLGFNDELREDGLVGDRARKAVRLFREWAESASSGKGK